MNRWHAHLRHDRRDRLVQGILITVGATLIGLVLAPPTIEALTDFLGPYRAALVGSVAMAAAMTLALRWIDRP